MKQNNSHNLFKSSSTTFFGSSRFFPAEVRDDVSTLYSFVRTVDNFVDAIPQDIPSYDEFKQQYLNAAKGQKSGNLIIDSFIELSKRRRFDPAWAEAFIRSMDMDLTARTYSTIEDTEEYIYGSAGVVGLFMARIMNLPEKSYPYAALLGKSFQFVNFIRDVAEDVELKRNYFPKEDLERFNLHSLSAEEANANPNKFASFLRYEIERYRKWQKEAELGYTYIPRRYLIPIKTAASLYMWTAERIAANPLVVYQRKVKPSMSKVILTGIVKSCLP